MNLGNRVSTIAILVLVAFAAIIVLPTAALASREGRQNTAVALTAAAIAAAIMGKRAPAIVLGGGAAYAWKRHEDARRYDWSDSRYRGGYDRGSYRDHDRDYRSGRYNPGYGRGYGDARYGQSDRYNDSRHTWRR